MARIEWGNQARGKWGCSYKKVTLIVCSINIVIALYVLRCLYSSVYIYSSDNTSSQDSKFLSFIVFFYTVFSLLVVMIVMVFLHM